MMWLMLILMGCRPPPEAPSELSDLTRYLYANWHHEDQDVVGVGLVNLEEFIEGIDLDASLNDRSWELGSIGSEDVADVPNPDGANPAETLGVGVAYQSVWPVSDHVKLQLEVDQRPGEPSADLYERSFPNDADPDCFTDRTCNPLYTENLVQRTNLILSVEGTLFKEFKWFDIGEDSERWAVMSRSYISDRWIGEAEKTEIVQSYSIDVWIPQGDETLRFQTLWSQSEIPNASDNLTMGTVKFSTDDIFKAGDDAIEELYHGGR